MGVKAVYGSKVIEPKLRKEMEKISMRNILAFAHSYLTLCLGYLFLRGYLGESLNSIGKIYIIIMAIATFLSMMITGILSVVFRNEQFWLTRKGHGARYMFSCNKDQVPYVALSIAVTCLLMELFIFE